MEKWNHLQLNEYEIIDFNEEKDSNYEYEEITVNELLERTNTDKHKFLTKYAAINIHCILHQEGFSDCIDLLHKANNDPRLKNLNAIVFLLLKPKGNRNTFHSIDSLDKYKQLVSTAKKLGVRIGMDSCSAPLMLKTAEYLNMENVIQSIEPCESGLFSTYIDVDGKIYPCSFCPGSLDFKAIDMLEINDFLKDAWYSTQIVEWRNKLLNSSSKCIACKMQKHCRSCPVFDITLCHHH